MEVLHLLLYFTNCEFISIPFFSIISQSLLFIEWNLSAYKIRWGKQHRRVYIMSSLVGYLLGNTEHVDCILQECFDPIVDGMSGGDLIPLMVYR